MKSVILCHNIISLVLLCNSANALTCDGERLFNGVENAEINNVCSASESHLTNVYFVRLKHGIIPVPTRYQLQTVEKGDKYIFHSIPFYDGRVEDYDGIFIVNNHSIDELNKTATLLPPFPSLEYFNEMCGYDATSYYHEETIGKSGKIIGMYFLDLGDQYIAYKDTNEDLIPAMLEAFARLNCLEKKQTDGK